MGGGSYSVYHDGVMIPVTRSGRGRPLVLCPGLCCSQAELSELSGFLRRDHDVVTFDLRGHGRASASPARYSLDGFARDLAAVLDTLDFPAPVLAGYSMGADLVVCHAAAHPGAFAGLVLIDGANPVPEPFLTEADLPEFRAMLEDPATREAAEQALGTERQVLLTAEDILRLNLEIDELRTGILDRFRRIDAPVSMIMSRWMAGQGAEGFAPRFNRNWRAGVERLVRELPDVSLSWLDADHRLVTTHAGEIAGIIGAGAGTG